MEIQTSVRPLSRLGQFEKYPLLEMLFSMIDEEEAPAGVEPHENGVELRFRNKISGAPNRGRLRIFFPESKKCCLLFYKRSLLPLSHQSYSYGEVVMEEGTSSHFGESDVRQWVAYLLNGLQPGFRPRNLSKRIPYTIPEN